MSSRVQKIIQDMVVVVVMLNIWEVFSLSIAHNQDILQCYSVME